jgi:hypothetical protein
VSRGEIELVDGRGEQSQMGKMCENGNEVKLSQKSRGSRVLRISLGRLQPRRNSFRGKAAPTRRNSSFQK